MTRKLKWDLSESHTLSQIGWSPQVGTAVYHEQDVVLDLEVAGNQRELYMSEVYVWSDSNNIADIGRITLETQRMTLKQAITWGERFAEDYGLDDAEAVAWYKQKRKDANDTSDFYITQQTSQHPQVAIYSKNLVIDGERFYKIVLDFLWETPLLTAGDELVEIKPKEPRHWDLSQSHQIKQLGWSPEYAGEVYTEQNVRLTLQLPNGYKLEDWPVRKVLAVEQEGYFLSLMLESDPLSVEEAYQEGLRLARLLNLKEEEIEAWYARNKDTAQWMDIFYAEQKGSLGSGAPVVFMQSGVFGANEVEPRHIIILRFLYFGTQ